MRGAAACLDRGQNTGRAAMVILALLVAVCWVFPRFWYTRAAEGQSMVWYVARTNVPGWRFEPQAVDKSAEARLAADSVTFGEYRREEGEVVRLFTARRFAERSEEIGLFVHTPDRCWTESGWKIEPVDGDYQEVDLGGGRYGVERRLFTHPAGARELVYFFGLVGGQPLPYRLDHNLGVGQRFRREALADRSGTGLRAADRVLWRRVWDSFANRRPLLGPKEFVRISTPVLGSSLERPDALLKAALAELLQVEAFSPAGMR